MKNSPELHGWSASGLRRTGFAAVALLTFIAGEVIDLRAAWISIPCNPKLETGSTKPLGRTVSAVRRGTRPSVVTISSEKVEAPDDDSKIDQGQVASAEEESTFDDELGTDKPAAKSNQIRLRPRFETDEPILATLPEESTPISSTPVSKWAEPTITPKSTAPFENKTSREPKRIIEDSQEKLLKPEPGTAKSPELQLGTMKDDIANPTADDVPASDFPKEQVIALKRKLDSAVALNPGELASRVITEPVENTTWDQTTENQQVEVRKIRLKKRPRQKPIVHSNLAEEIGKSQQPTVGHATMIQWRSARNDEATIQTSKEVESKNGQLAQDLRKSLGETSKCAREASSTPMEPQPFSARNSDIARTERAEPRGREGQFASTTVSRNTSDRSRVHGSLWDNAAVPPGSDFSGTIGGNAKMMDSRSVDLGYAPKPPSDPMVEQVSFDKPAELFSRRTLVKDPTRAAGDQDERQIALERDELDREQIKDHDTRSRVNAVKGPFQWISHMFRIHFSTGSLIFGMSGAALCIAGIWVVRETIRSKSN